MDLSEYVKGYNRKSYVYDLYGICNHNGSAFAGHYTAYIKVADGSWWHFNDTSTTKVEDLNDLKTSNAYCFFYRKQMKKISQ